MEVSVGVTGRAKEGIGIFLLTWTLMVEIDRLRQYQGCQRWKALPCLSKDSFAVSSIPIVQEKKGVAADFFPAKNDRYDFRTHDRQNQSEFRN